MKAVLVRSRFVMLAALAVLIGCAGQPRFGTFVEVADSALRVVAVDAARRVEETWPAEQHRMHLSDAATDPFATALASELRRAGFRVFTQEAVPKGAVELHFAVDTLGDSGLLRVTLYVQQSHWSRAYSNAGGKVSPAGPWTGFDTDGGR